MRLCFEEMKIEQEDVFCIKLGVETQHTLELVGALMMVSATAYAASL
jgi:NADPH-dependent curcumin reductase CurA